MGETVPNVVRKGHSVRICRIMKGLSGSNAVYGTVVTGIFSAVFVCGWKWQHIAVEVC